MAKLVNGLYIPDEKDIINGRFKPDPEVSGKRFEPDGNGGGTLWIRRRRMRPGFRKPIEEWIAVKKQPMQGRQIDH
jgi:hypothetical protein